MHLREVRERQGAGWVHNERINSKRKDVSAPGNGKGPKATWRISTKSGDFKDAFKKNNLLYF